MSPSRFQLLMLIIHFICIPSLVGSWLGPRLWSVCCLGNRGSCSCSFKTEGHEEPAAEVKHLQTHLRILGQCLLLAVSLAGWQLPDLCCRQAVYRTGWKIDGSIDI